MASAQKRIDPTKKSSFEPDDHERILKLVGGKTYCMIVSKEEQKENGWGESKASAYYSASPNPFLRHSASKK